MPLVEIETEIAAPLERVFDLARSVDLHVASASGTGERPVDGVVTGLIGLGQEVTWSARHFGVRQRLTVRITALDRPRHFTDVQIRGPFRRMEHRHEFESCAAGTRMLDAFEFESPCGILGRLADRLVLTDHLRRFLVERNRVLRATAESEAWRRYV